MEVTFLIAACMMLYFRFMTKIVLITHQCFGYCQAVLAQHAGVLGWAFFGIFFFPLHSASQWVGWEYAQSWKRTWSWELTWTDQRDVPYHTTLSSAIKYHRKEGEGGDIHVCGISLPSNHSVHWSSVCKEAPGHLPANGKPWTNSWFD